MIRGCVFAVGLGLGLTATACATPRLRVSSELSWTRAQSTQSAPMPESVAATDEYSVAAGDVLRVESKSPLRVVSLFRSFQGEAEVASTMTPKDGVILLRPDVGTSALRLPHGVVVHAGVPREPEISWFDLETEALAWGRSPLGTPFPALAAASRVDVEIIAQVDAVLRDVRTRARDLARADAASTAVRGLVALRALRSLQGVRSYPYARNAEVPLASSVPTRAIQGRTFVSLVPEHAATVSIDGPTEFAVSSRVVRGRADVIAAVRVREGIRVRDESRAAVHALAPDPELTAAARATSASSDSEIDPTLATLRRVFVHVPPGRHTYAIEAIGAPVWVTATTTSAYLRIEDVFSGAKSQERLGAKATFACESPDLVGTCALALALTGQDGGARFDSVFQAATPLAQRVSSALVGGAPADRAARLESEASSGEGAVLAALADDASHAIDTSLRDAWWRTTARETSWQTIDDGTPPTWFAFRTQQALDTACASRTDVRKASDEHELDAQPTSAFSVPWRRVRAVRLLVVAPCTSAEPIQIEVDGQTLSAQPGSPRTVWHVVVRGESARIRRVDRGAGHVYILSDDACSSRGALVHAARPLDLAATQALFFPEKTTSPGVEVWTRDSDLKPSFTLTSDDGREHLDIDIRSTNGLIAVDEQGTRWRRAASIPLPAWTLRGARATGTAAVAVRAVARGTSSEDDVKPTVYAQPTNVEAVVAASRKLLASVKPASIRAAALERGLLLASYGETRAALEDAELAKAYGDLAGEDPVALVRRALLPLAPTPLALGTNAYGIESDFDARAARCSPSGDGSRARVASLDTTLRTRGKNAPFDRAVAALAVNVANAALNDPRAETLVALATTNSKWQLLKAVEGGGGRVARPYEKNANPIVDAEGRLRPRLYAGDPFGAHFVSVSADRPARAFLADFGAASLHLDVMCIARKRAESSEVCPLEVRLGEARVTSRVGPDGRARVDLPRTRGRGTGADLTVSVAPSRGDFVALVRVVASAQATGTTFVSGVGWVLDTPHVQYRFLLPPGRPIRVRADVLSVLRIDATPEPGETVSVVASTEGHDVTLPPGGEPARMTLAAKGEVTLTARGGTATVAIANRIETLGKSTEEDVDPERVTARDVSTTSALMTLDSGPWRGLAEHSPPPLAWLEDRLGTVESHSGAVAGTIREGATSDTALDAYAFESLTVRRRIESLNLFTLASGLIRLRNGPTTYGGSVSLYEDLTALRLRVTGTLGAFAQAGFGAGANQTEYALRPRGFIEYSARVASDVSLLPRLGYDGYYTTLSERPASSRNIDDDLYNGFRFRRNTFAYLQGLLWYVPFFNQLFYLRARGTVDATNSAFSHASLRPGTFLILRALELAAYFDAQYFERTTNARTRSGFDVGGGIGVSVHLPLLPGSFEVRPNSTAQVRGDGGWQVFAGIALIGSYRRGASDYSSLELSFPEETSGGVPWRTESKGP